MSHYGNDPKSASKTTIKCNREAIDIFGRPMSGGEKVSVSPCESVANEKKVSVGPCGYVANKKTNDPV